MLGEGLFQGRAFPKEFFMARTAIDKLGWGANVILTIIPFLGSTVQGINRVLRGKPLIGIIWIFTAGLFLIGWIIDIITVITKKKITFLA